MPMSKISGLIKVNKAAKKEAEAKQRKLAKKYAAETAKYKRKGMMR